MKSELHNSKKAWQIKKLPTLFLVVAALLEALIGYLLLTGTALVFSRLEMALAILFSIAATLMFPFFLDIERRKKILSKRRYVVALIGLCAWCGFSLFGNALFVYPLDRIVAWHEIGLFLLSIVWFVPIVLFVVGLLLFLPNFLGAARDNIDNKNCRTLFFTIFTLALVCAALYLWAFNPAISSPDTNVIYAHAIDGTAETWQSPLLTVFYRICFILSKSPFLPVIAQVLFLAFCYAKAVTVIFQFGMKKWVCVFGAAILFLSPNFGTFHVTLWKDVPYLGCVLLIGVLFAECCLLARPVTIGVCIQLVVSSLVACLLKINCVVFVVIVLVVFAAKLHWNRKVLSAAVVSIILFVLIIGPVYQIFRVKSVAPGGMYIALGQDMRAVEACGGTLSETAQEIVDQQSGSEPYQVYRAGGASSMDWEGYEYQPGFLRFLGAYLDSFVRHPIIMIRSILCRADCMWNIKTGVNGEVLNAGYTGETLSQTYRDDLYQRKPNTLTFVLDKAVSLSQSEPASTFFWRTGIYLSLSLVMCYTLFLEGKKGVGLLLIPALSQALSLILSSGWISYRYYMPYAVFLLFFLACAVGYLRCEPAQKKVSVNQAHQEAACDNK